MASKRKFVLQVERFVDTEITILVRRQMDSQIDVRRIGAAIDAMKARRVFTLLPNSVLSRVEHLLKVLPGMTLHQSTARRSTLAHLFGGAVRDDAARTAYFRSMRELMALVERPDFVPVLRNPQAARVLEEHARGISLNLAGTAERYGDLADELGACNAIVKRLYPNDYGSLRLDAHHVIEDRAYDRFADAWKILGWKSADDMPALPVFYERHIRSPKRLPGLADLGERLDATSLSQELLKSVDVQRFKSAEELIAAYDMFYVRAGLAKDTRPVLNAISRELTKRRTAAALVKAVKGR